MKYLAILALAAMAIGLGACAKHDTQTAETSHTAATSSTYAK